MSLLTAHIRRLIDAGADAAIAAEVAAEIFVAGVQSAPLRVDEAAERRREKDRERKRAVRRNPQTSAESADGSEQKKGPPITPLKKTYPPEANASDPQRSKQGTRLPDDWQIPESVFRIGRELGYLDRFIAFQMDRFRDHFGSVSGAQGLKRNWDLAAQ